MKRIFLSFFTILVLSLFFYSSIYADEEMAPNPYVTTSAEGRYYFKMSPDPTDQWDREKGFGVAYKTTIGNTDKKLWTTEGWYAFSVFLSNNGAYLVRVGNWPRGHEPSNKHLAVAFYENGKLLKSYSTRELIRDDYVVEASISHYQFLKDYKTAGFIGNFIFQMVTVDGTKYKFDVQTGEIVDKIYKN